MIRLVDLEDIPALCRIYNYYVENTITTFEDEPISHEELAHRISIVSRNFPWLVYEDKNQVLGFAYGNYWKARSAYRNTLETTIYLDYRYTGRGIGKTLYASLLDQLSTRDGLHRLLACISLPNDASVALHENLGFNKVGQFSEAGWKFGRWVDVGYWELALLGE